MNTKHLHYLLHPVFLLGLGLLLLNDHYWKAAYGNWWTGKISDFAGVLLLPLFWKAVFGGRNRTALLVTVGFLTWWKLPVSQPAIDALRSVTGLAHGRTVDLTDLMAFAVLPVAGWALRNPIVKFLAPARRRPQLQYAAYTLLLPVTLLALIATSAPDDDVSPRDGDTLTCCLEPPFRGEVPGGTLYLPNAFSPDGDGINDFLQFIPEGGNLRVDTFRVSLQANNAVVYEAVNVTDFSPINGFDGTVNDTIVPQQFYVDVFYTSPDGPRRFSGSVCSLPCADPSGVSGPINLNLCRYSTQWVTGRGFNEDQESFEDYTDCFE